MQGVELHVFEWECEGQWKLVDAHSRHVSELLIVSSVWSRLITNDTRVLGRVKREECE